MRLNPFRAAPRRRASRDYNDDSGWLKPETKRAVLGVVLIIFSVIAILSFFTLAGPTGKALLRGLQLSFGWIGYVFPLATFVVGLALVRPGWFLLERWRWVGMGLLLAGLLGLSHLMSGRSGGALQAAIEGGGGGYLGFLLSYPLSVLLSSIAAGILFAGVLIVGILMTFNVSVHDVFIGFRAFLPGKSHKAGGGGEAAAEVEVPRFRVNTMTPPTTKPDTVQLKQQQQEEQQKQKARQLLKSANRRYKAPGLELLHASSGQPDSGNIKENAQKIQHALNNFGIAVTMGEVNVGPTVTQYTLRPEEGIKLSRITALQNDLALALAAHPIRIEAPIPKKNLVGIEIPNKSVALVRLRDLLASKEFKQAESPLSFVVGKDVAGATVVDTLERMPHLLIAGATGSGKSVGISTMLISWLYRNSPSILRLILVDPKRVELSVYDGIPHLLTPVIIDPSKTINALKWALKEMDRRYHVLSESRSRNLLSFNTNNPNEAMPLIVIVIDELADLMAKYARDVEGAIIRLSQMARAVGIHLVLATQRPSVNVITGLIKANIPTRVAYHVASQIDSRTILDAAGAEKLLGNGDLLYLSGEAGKPRRLQGSFVSEDEVHRVVEAIKENADEPAYDESVVAPVRDVGGMTGDAGEDELFEEAKTVVMQSGKASASLLQRRLRVGYARAARLLDMLQEQNIIGSGEGNKPREVLARPEMETVAVDTFENNTPHEEEVASEDYDKEW